ncbi:MAG: phytanoyl-CoA dioxygenase family protein [Leptospiraceae bacterium]|nr:phytanoyl-CoA dioxygenase family protein [Leptospiraceae bacterium]
MEILHHNQIIRNPDYNSNERKNFIFQGKILLFENCKFAKLLKDFAVSFLKENLKTEDLQNFEHQVSKDEFYKILSTLKKTFSNLQTAKIFIKDILNELNFPIKNTYFDLLRLRNITSYMHLVEDAKPAFAIHRDTWYANPETQINWWIPLFDVNAYDTFAFYPKYFTKAVKNNSHEFNYDIWNNTGGFQSSLENRTRIFPELKEKIDFTDELKISCHAGDLLVFSAAHLHGTRPNTTGQTRFSLDFRTVEIDDILGAPSVDNFSKGSIFKDMIPIKTIF